MLIKVLFLSPFLIMDTMAIVIGTSAPYPIESNMESVNQGGEFQPICVHCPGIVINHATSHTDESGVNHGLEFK